MLSRVGSRVRCVGPVRTVRQSPTLSHVASVTSTIKQAQAATAGLSTSSTSSTSSSKAPPQPSAGVAVAVKAYYIARSIDVEKAHSMVYSSWADEFQKKSVTVTLDASLNQHISIFKYGSVV
jgi:hypothetical protein